MTSDNWRVLITNTTQLIPVLLLALAGLPIGILVLHYSRKKIESYRIRKGQPALPTGFLQSRWVQVLVVAANAAGWAGAIAITSDILKGVLVALLVSLAIAISLIDWQVRVIPNQLLIVLVIAGTTFQLVQFGTKGLLTALITMIVVFGVFAGIAAAIGFDKVGAGDVKLAGAIGLTLGYPDILMALLWISAAFFAFIIIGFLLRKLTLKSMFPYGPFMMLGMILSIIRIFMES